LLHGSKFKYKFCALVFLRIKTNGYKFKLASNVKGLGKFDDVVVEYVDDNRRNSHIFVQIKSQTTQQITMQQLLADRGDFSLRTYYKSYIETEEKFNCSKLGMKMDGSVDDSLFVIYTKADVATNLKSKKLTYVGKESFLMAGGSVLQFNEAEHKNIYDHLHDLPKHREFLSRFRIFYSQAEDSVMGWIIKIELQRRKNLSKIEVDIAYKCFFDFMKDWCKHRDFVLKDTSSGEHNPLRRHKAT
jgi:hypothetical protein